MQNKLQELTEKLYAEGLSKGRQEAEEIKSRAQKEAEEIIASAKKEYDSILQKARKEADALKSKTENEIRSASLQTYSTLKQSIENILTINTVQAPIQESINDKEFVRELILTAAKSYDVKNNENVTLEVLVPEKLKEKMDIFIKESITKQLNVSVEVKGDKKIIGGFRIGKKGEGYHVSFTDQDFQNLFCEYIRPKTKELIFG